MYYDLVIKLQFFKNSFRSDNPNTTCSHRNSRTISEVEEVERRKSSAVLCCCAVFGVIVVLLTIVALAYYGLHYKKSDEKFTIWIEDGNHGGGGGGQTQISHHQEHSVISYLSMPFVFIIQLFIGPITSQLAPSSKTSPTPNSSEVAEGILSSMNISINACDDFYEYVCGNYEQNHPIPPDQENISDQQRIQMDVLEKMKNALNSAETSSSKAIEKMKTIWKTCNRDEEYLGKAQNHTMDVIKNLGGWPLIEGNDQWNSTDFNLQFFVEALNQIGDFGTPLFKISFERAATNYSRRFVMFQEMSSNDFIVPTEFWSKGFTKQRDEAIMKAKRQVEMFAKNVGLPKNSRIDEDFQEMLEFEKEIAYVMQKQDETFETLSEPFEQFNNRFKRRSGFDIKQYILVTTGGIDPSRFDVSYQNQKYIRIIAGLLKNANPKVLVNYMMFNVMRKYSFLFGNEFEEIGLGTKKMLFGLERNLQRWRRCAELTARMKKAYGALYVRKFFDQKTRKHAAALVEKVMAAFMEMLEENMWMDEETKKRAMKKLQEMIVTIGHGALALDDKKLDGYYEQLEITNFDSLAEIWEKLSKWERSKKFNEFLGEWDRHTINDMAVEVNPIADLSRNSFVLSAALLQPPIFDKDQPQALNFGGLGSAIGREITHHFDVDGRMFNEFGRREEWWTNETTERFMEKTKCFMEQYADIQLEITNFDSLPEIWEKLSKWERSKKFNEFLGEWDRHTINDMAVEVNPIADLSRNSFVLSAALLQPPIFDKDQPQALNFGGLGSAIGREITHHFDVDGRMFNEFGRREEWWTNETTERFMEKTKCFMEQYADIQVPDTNGMHVNGHQTIEENIADNGGIRGSFKAFKRFVKENESLPGLTLTRDQLFFFGYAKFFCEARRSASLKEQILHSRYAPNRYRVNTVLGNQPEFAKAFGCPAKSPMNPEKKCSIW